MFSFNTHIRDTITVRFSLQNQIGPDGSSAIVGHTFELVDDDQAIKDRIQAACAGLDGGARESARESAAFDEWARLIRSVEGYADGIDDLAGADLISAFRTATVYAGSPDLERIKREMRRHATRAFWGYLGTYMPDYTFR